MPKKKTKMTPKDQSARFRAEVERMIAAGELSPTEADESLDRIMRGAKMTSPPTGGAKDKLGREK